VEQAMNSGLELQGCHTSHFGISPLHAAARTVH
jgi:hypothetical protein